VRDNAVRRFVTQSGVRIYRIRAETFPGQINNLYLILDGDHQRPWKEGERRESRLVFIGRNLPEDNIRQGFEACVA